MNDRYRLDLPATAAAVEIERTMSRVVRGGIAGKTRTACEVRADGSFTCARAGQDDVDGWLTPDQLALIDAICQATDFCDLPSYIDIPVRRTDSYLWTYQVGDHEVSVRDADRAGDAVPAALRTLDALCAALESGLAVDAPGGSDS